ncbi:RloB [Beggiatoa sp. PS]|nr:RloB [Beggiatoa sp. PS]
MRDDLHLSSADIEIVGETGSAPISVVDAAIARYKKNTDYDRVYCVFDKDKHTTYQKALQKIRDTRLPKKGKLYATNSVPCFEYWLLLHFVYTTRPFHANGKKSICEQVIVELKEHFPNYQKGNQGIFEKIKDKTDIAIQRTKQVEQYHKDNATETDNPSTRVYELVQYLQNLK